MKLFTASASPASSEFVQGTLRELGVESYWQQVSPLITQYGFRVLAALGFLIVALYAASLAARATRRALERGHIEPTLAAFCSNIARALILVMAVLTCMGIVGIPVTSFAAMLGAGGLAVGLALQGALSNIAAGAALSITRPFKVGDSVVVAGQRGIVDEIGLFSTILHTDDNRRIIIPNGQIFGTIIENMTHHPVRRLTVVVQVALDEDVDGTRGVLLNSLRNLPGIESNPTPSVVLTGMTDAAIEWEIHAWARIERLAAARESVIRELKRALEAAGIQRPLVRRHIQVEHVDGDRSDRK